MVPKNWGRRPYVQSTDTINLAHCYLKVSERGQTLLRTLDWRRCHCTSVSTMLTPVSSAYVWRNETLLWAFSGVHLMALKSPTLFSVTTDQTGSSITDGFMFWMVRNRNDLSMKRQNWKNGYYKRYTSFDDFTNLFVWLQTGHDLHSLFWEKNTLLPIWPSCETAPSPCSGKPRAGKL